MSIPGQLPQLVTAQRSSALQTLALQAGQVLDAKVLGPAPNGGTQVEIAGQKLNLLLPTLIKAGQSMKLEVLSTGPQIRLAIQPNQAPAAPATQTIPTLATRVAPLVGAQVAAPPSQTTLAPTRAPQGAAIPPPAPQSQTTALLPANAPVVSSTIAQTPTPPPVAANASSVATPAPTAVSAPPQTATGPVGQPGIAPPLTAAPASPATAAVPQGLPSATQTSTLSSLTTAAPVPAVETTPVVSVPLHGYPRQFPIPQTPATVSQAPSAAMAAPGAPSANQTIAAAMPLDRPVLSGTSTQVPQATTPQAALVQMVQSSVPRQDAMTSLTSALVSIAGKVALPEQVIRAAQQVMAGRVNLDDGFDGPSLAKAVSRSGVFQEATIARGAVPTPQSDMKSALLALRTTLASWLGQQAALIPAGRVAPPLRGAVPRVGRGDAPPIDPAAPAAEIGKHLLDRTEASLSRLRLHQNASLPDAAGRSNADWSMDIPVMIGPHQTILQLQIHRDQHGSTEEAGERGWQMRFALNVPELGEVGAQVSLRGANTGVMLWATNPAASKALELEVDELRAALVSVGLKPGAVIVRHGEPPAAPASVSGHFVDATR